MPRKKAKDQSKLLTHPIIFRVTEEVFAKLETLVGQSDCTSIGEVARRIVSKGKLTIYTKDVSMNASMEELALIRKELKSIGVNINQITRTFNQDKEGNQRAYYVLQVADLYKKVDAKVDRLLEIVSSLAEKWLQKS